MTEITLTTDQSQQFFNATDGVILCDDSGKVVARIPPVCSEEEKATLAEASRRLSSDQPRHASAEVLERLGSLEQE